jgi:hypothetical protein
VARFIWLRIGTIVGFYEHRNGFSGPVKGKEYLDWLSEYQLLKMDSAK